MKFLFTLLFVFLSIGMYSQSSFSKDDAIQIVDTFFDGLHKGDTLMMRSVIVENLPMQTVFTTGSGENKVVASNGEDFIKTIATRPVDQVWKEKLLGYEVQIDGNLAHVWTPYEFWYNGTFSHCGANAFTMGNTSEGWKILHIIDSRRKNACESPKD